MYDVDIQYVYLWNELQYVQDLFFTADLELSIRLNFVRASSTSAWSVLFVFVQDIQSPWSLLLQGDMSLSKRLYM